MKPIIKWAGGKSQILPLLIERLPENFNSYFEPFAGGLALALALEKEEIFVSDVSAEVINLYECVAQNPDRVLAELADFATTEKDYYRIRSMDKEPGFANMDVFKKAARFLYLNKNGYNGLWRVNKDGFNNVPRGRYSCIHYGVENVREVGRYLGAHAHIEKCSFEQTTIHARENDFVYFDPPYHNTFTNYNAQGFNEEMQRRLKAEVDRLTQLNVKVMLSNNDDMFIRELYADYNIVGINAKRYLNSDGNNRTDGREVIVTNY